MYGTFICVHLCTKIFNIYFVMHVFYWSIFALQCCTTKWISYVYTYMDVRVGLWRKLSPEKLMLLNYGVAEDSWESLGLQRDQSWVFIGRTDAEAETPILWPPDAKSWLIWKDPGAGKDWGQEEKGTTEDEIVGWHHWLNGDEFE